MPLKSLEGTFDGMRYYYAEKIEFNYTKNIVLEKPKAIFDVSQQEYEEISLKKLQ